MSESEPAPYRFRGFTAPTFTQVPDELFDELAPQLTEAELADVLLVTAPDDKEAGPGIGATLKLEVIHRGFPHRLENERL